MYQYIVFNLDGIKENKLYPGMAQLLRDLKERGVMMAVMADKPKDVVDGILKECEIDDCFSAVIGCEEDEECETWTQVLSMALSVLKKKAGRRFKPEKALMVGARSFDVEAAKQEGIASVAVAYSQAPEGELSACGSDFLVDSVEQLEEIITGEPVYFKYRNKNAFTKTIEILLPLFLFWAVELIVYNVGYVLVGKYVPALAEHKNQLAVWLNAVASISTWPMLARLYAQTYCGDTSYVITRRNKALLKRDAVLVAAYAVALGLGLNILTASLQVFRISEAYEQVAGVQYSVSLPVGLVIYGVLTPFTEELIFRGIIYNRIRKYFPMPVTMFASALIFGCFHGNMVQMMYAVIMGMALALVYEIYGRYLAAPLLFHCSANMLVYILSKSNVFSKGSTPVLYGVALLAVAMGITSWYIQRLMEKRNRR
ncbi:MAG: CPBP family intramembrane metalloprotease [Lachnospiraceae bacterium]|nr:CPBP family intramembrane metalloprotease [Lachnospiraceae bacterium]